MVHKKEISSFEENLYNLEKNIKNFGNKISRCSLPGLIDSAKEIELDIKNLDTTLSGFLETTAVDEIRNKRLNINLNKLKGEYYIWKVGFENMCECTSR